MLNIFGMIWEWTFWSKLALYQVRVGRPIGLNKFEYGKCHHCPRIVCVLWRNRHRHRLMGVFQFFVRPLDRGGTLRCCSRQQCGRGAFEAPKAAMQRSGNPLLSIIQVYHLKERSVQQEWPAVPSGDWSCSGREPALMQINDMPPILAANLWSCLNSCSV